MKRRLDELQRMKEAELNKWLQEAMQGREELSQAKEDLEKAKVEN